jgi:integrase
MAKRLGLREIKALETGQVVWDSAVAGFGARRRGTEAVTYVLKYRNVEGRQRWYTIGFHGKWTPDLAREEARRLLGEVAQGRDPAAAKQTGRNAATVAELCDAYLKDLEAGKVLTRHGQSKKASTLVTDRSRIARHIKPLLGTMKVGAMTRADVEKFMHDVAAGKTKLREKTTKNRGLAIVRGGKGAATRTVGLLGAIFTYGRVQPNPVWGVVRYADGKKTRRLSEAEYNAVGEALKKAEAEPMWPPAIAAIKFLLLTGWRSGEAAALKWSELNLPFQTALLGDTKTAQSVRPLSKAACEVLKKAPSTDDYVFPASRGDGLISIDKFWDHVVELGTLQSDITPHTLRHSFASLAGDMQYSQFTIAGLIGHKKGSVTAGYVHAADPILIAAADAVAQKTAELVGLVEA